VVEGKMVETILGEKLNRVLNKEAEEVFPE
jgi:hypothetical protein